MHHERSARPDPYAVEWPDIAPGEDDWASARRGVACFSNDPESQEWMRWRRKSNSTACETSPFVSSGRVQEDRYYSCTAPPECRLGAPASKNWRRATMCPSLNIPDS